MPIHRNPNAKPTGHAAPTQHDVAMAEAQAGEQMVRDTDNRAASREIYACAAIHRAFSVLASLTPRE